MATRFDDWECPYLEHYGVIGMKWGVRRYQNPDGTLTLAGQKRYGMTDTGTGGKWVSGRSLAKSYNSADQVRANAIGERNLKAQKAYKYGKKFTDRGNKLAAKGKNPLADRKTMRLMNKAKKAVAEADRFKKEADDAALLQKRIVKKALSQGYGFQSKEVKRFAQTGKQWVAQALGGLTGQAAYVAMNRKQLSVKGSTAKFTLGGTQSARSSRTNRRTPPVPLTDKQSAYINRQLAGMSPQELERRKVRKGG